MIAKEYCVGRAKFLTSLAFAADYKNTMLRIEGIFKRNCLSILYISRFALVETGVVFIGYLFGTFLRTQTAGDAFLHVHVARVPDQFDFKITLFTANAVNFRERQQFDIDVPADLDQFRRNNSHGTVIGGKRFVQLGHHAPN